MMTLESIQSSVTISVSSPSTIIMLNQENVTGLAIQVSQNSNVHIDLTKSESGEGTTDSTKSTATLTSDEHLLIWPAPILISSPDFPINDVSGQFHSDSPMPELKHEASLCMLVELAAEAVLNDDENSSPTPTTRRAFQNPFQSFPTTLSATLELKSSFADIATAHSNTIMSYGAKMKTSDIPAIALSESPLDN